jgi:hypothetical protein
MEAAGLSEMLAVYYQMARLQETVILIFSALRTSDVAETLTVFPILVFMIFTSYLMADKWLT